MAWKTAHAFVQGRDHVKYSIPCQDRTFSIVEKHIAVVSLADGAGSCKYSQIGAELATKVVCRLLKKEFEFLFRQECDFIKTFVHSELIKQIRKKSLSLAVDEEELAPTLQFVAVKDNRFVAGHIGDGTIGILTEFGIEVLSHPERGESSNITYFVTDPWALDHFRIYKGYLAGIKGFILMSDGVCESLYDYQEKILNDESARMLDWLIDYSLETVKSALKRNLVEVLGERSTDDCSVCLLRLVEHNADVLDSLDYQILFPF
ncbi:MAG: protein phosphatase 2C domain-containing protein [Deltaproteobacteria bacterium]|nr:protein phosphatase 2C domain-containing protein [Candidatus Zymogenaceae bacterium]